MIYKKSWKYILFKNTDYYCKNCRFFKIKSLKDFSNVRKGKIGGYIGGYHNLSQEGDCWVYDTARISRRAKVTGNVKIKNDSLVTDYAIVSGDAIISGKTMVFDFANITDNAKIYNTVVKDKAVVYGNTELKGEIMITGTLRIGNNNDLQKILEIPSIQR